MSLTIFAQSNITCHTFCLELNRNNTNGNVANHSNTEYIELLSEDSLLMRDDVVERAYVFIVRPYLFNNAVYRLSRDIQAQAT